jgi:hypothetical protein
MASVTYNPVGTPGSSFKQPRQKMWGVFQRPNTQAGQPYWDLVLMTNDLQAAKNTINSWLQNPPTGQYALGGLNNIILCEVIPVDSNVEI